MLLMGFQRVSVSIDSNQKVLDTSIREVGYFFPSTGVIKDRFFQT